MSERKILPTAVPGSCGFWFGGPGFGGRFEADGKMKKKCFTGTPLKCFHGLFICHIIFIPLSNIIIWTFLQAQIEFAGHAAQKMVISRKRDTRGAESAVKDKVWRGSLPWSLAILSEDSALQAKGEQGEGETIKSKKQVSWKEQKQSERWGLWGKRQN